jgi:hypothetical protein
MTTQNPAQDVSDAAIAAAFREFCQLPQLDRCVQSAPNWINTRARELQQAQGVGERKDALEAVGEFGIEVEKLLCAALGREWRPSGFSIESLIEELKAKAPPQSSAPVVGEPFVHDVHCPQMNHQCPRCTCESALTGRA